MATTTGLAPIPMRFKPSRWSWTCLRRPLILLHARPEFPGRVFPHNYNCPVRGFARKLFFPVRTLEEAIATCDWFTLGSFMDFFREFGHPPTDMTVYDFAVHLEQYLNRSDLDAHQAEHAKRYAASQDARARRSAARIERTHAKEAAWIAILDGPQ